MEMQDVVVVRCSTYKGGDDKIEIRNMKEADT